MEDQYITEELNVDFNKFGSIVNKYIPKIEEVRKEIKIPTYEFQESIKKFAPIYGRRVYSLPYEKWYTDFKLNKAHEQCVKYNQVGNVRYLIKVMRGM